MVIFREVRLRTLRIGSMEHRNVRVMNLSIYGYKNNRTPSPQEPFQMYKISRSLKRFN
uniref:Uncharacterized protein n=1 Tax=Ascaris lumbricoides TaxID=6252 RepID=A0A0M3HJQ5_ASCLU